MKIYGGNVKIVVTEIQRKGDRNIWRFIKKIQILLSQKYGKGGRKFAEIQGTDLTLGAVGSDKILKENPIWNWRQIDLTPF